MKLANVFGLLTLLASLFLLGCQGQNAKNPGNQNQEAASSKEEKIKAALAQLSPEDRKLAEAQKFCAVMKKNRLGAMGKPFKVMLKGQPVFLCCDHCQEKARKDPEKILEQAKKLKASAN